MSILTNVKQSHVSTHKERFTLYEHRPALKKKKLSTNTHRQRSEVFGRPRAVLRWRTAAHRMPAYVAWAGVVGRRRRTGRRRAHFESDVAEFVSKPVENAALFFC